MCEETGAKVKASYNYLIQSENTETGKLVETEFHSTDYRSGFSDEGECLL